jgi:hypothetical protein
MDKQHKDKKSMPKTQNRDKTDTNFQRTKNAADVRGEMALRGHHPMQDNNNKSNSRKEKNS